MPNKRTCYLTECKNEFGMNFVTNVQMGLVI